MSKSSAIDGGASTAFEVSAARPAGHAAIRTLMIGNLSDQCFGPFLNPQGVTAGIL
jgi:hypothetical protein